MNAWAAEKGQACNCSGFELAASILIQHIDFLSTQESIQIRKKSKEIMQRELLTPILKTPILETFPLGNRSTIYLHKEDEQHWEKRTQGTVVRPALNLQLFWISKRQLQNAPTNFTPELCAYDILEMDFQTLSFAVPSVLCSANAGLMAWLISTDGRRK